MEYNIRNGAIFDVKYQLCWQLFAGYQIFAKINLLQCNIEANEIIYYNVTSKLTR